jgi:uncharacterized membrane protein YdjX (TVP38/TMEM64 family)
MSGRTVVIGGGIVGASVAYHLARAGTETLLIDREDEGRATDAGAGILSPATSSRTGSEAWFEFATEAVGYYPELAGRLEEEADRPTSYARTGLLAVAAGYGLGLAGFPLALALVVATSFPPYWIAGAGAGDGTLATAGERLVAETGDLRSVVGSRLLPLPSDVVSAGAGVAGVPARTFALGTAIGEVPWVAAGVVAGDSFGALDGASLAAAMDPRVAVGAAILAALAFAGPTYRLYCRL